MKLQKNTLFALYSVLESAADPQRQFSAGEVARKYRISPHHLTKVLHTLARAAGHRRGPGAGVERAIGTLLAEIDAMAEATLRSITIATLLKLIERQRRG